ncbi:DUF3040 domain-containing protein [Blastococcus sp. Marseille-P5729]|uniref:DUF3040 domain-containing protein n=1 Tax=Blastococcus sp. Marseille-P5729 TaxID=2086582 RepID=UPI000D0E6729|nr:DUF3040 domain-containing protein [Blastococcus sp. Marseille-P5729]
MPLSEHEQRVLEQIERSLYEEDPKFRATVKKTTRPRANLGSLRLAIVLGVVGLAVLVGGVWLQNVIVGVLGFLIMLAGGTMGVRATQNGAKPGTRGKQGKQGKGSKRSGQRGSSRGRANGGVADKAQERLRRRFEGEQ